MATLSNRIIGKILAFDEENLNVQIIRCSSYVADFEGGLSWSKVGVHRYEELTEKCVKKKHHRKKLSNVIPKCPCKQIK